VFLAAGGMGSVFVGRRRDEPSRLLAIKRPHRQLLGEPGFRSALVREAKLSGSIRHPNVVGIEDVEEVDGELLLVMPYVHAGALTELFEACDVRKERLPQRVALRIVRDSAVGLEAAHDLKAVGGLPLGLVHRDVSPHNVLVGLDGRARLVDFGIAKATLISSAGDRTATGVLKGKMGYMAPEVLQGKPATARSDLFSLGVLAWEAFTNEPLFSSPAASDVEIAQRILRSPTYPSMATVVQVPQPLEETVARALSKEAADRFASCAELLGALDRVAELVGLASDAEVGGVVRRLLEGRIRNRLQLLERAGVSLAKLSLDPDSPGDGDDDSTSSDSGKRTILRVPARIEAEPEPPKGPKGTLFDVPATPPPESPALDPGAEPPTTKLRAADIPQSADNDTTLKLGRVLVPPLPPAPPSALGSPSGPVSSPAPASAHAAPGRSGAAFFYVLGIVAALGVGILIGLFLAR
jgi:serine/threonine-protein kinase